MNSFNETVHHIAAKNGHTKIINYLANFGVNVNQLIFHDEPSPLYHAISNGHIEAVKCLVQHGAIQIWILLSCWHAKKDILRIWRLLKF